MMLTIAIGFIVGLFLGGATSCLVDSYTNGRSAGWSRGWDDCANEWEKASEETEEESK